MRSPSLMHISPRLNFEYKSLMVDFSGTEFGNSLSSQVFASLTHELIVRLLSNFDNIHLKIGSNKNGNNNCNAI